MKDLVNNGIGDVRDDAAVQSNNLLQVFAKLGEGSCRVVVEHAHHEVLERKHARLALVVVLREDGLAASDLRQQLLGVLIGDPTPRRVPLDRHGVAVFGEQGTQLGLLPNLCSGV